MSDNLGKLVQQDVKLLSKNKFDIYTLFKSRQGRGDISSLQKIRHHPAHHYLSHLKKHGAPVVLSSKPWSRNQINAAVARGPHKSAKEYVEFLRNEMHDFIRKAFWMVLPYSEISKIDHFMDKLRLSPIGVVPQKERRPRIIVDYSYWDLNKDTVKLAPAKAMQFGRALECLITKVVHADPRYGPVKFIKIDIADGFYRIWIRAHDIPKLGVVFPSLAGEEPLIAFPLVLPMGWTESPPYFCAATETATDIANQ